MCFGVRRGVCGVRREEVIRVRAHVRLVTQNLRVRIHQNKELEDFGPPSQRVHARSDTSFHPSASLEG